MRPLGIPCGHPEVSLERNTRYRNDNTGRRRLWPFDDGSSSQSPSAAGSSVGLRAFADTGPECVISDRCRADRG